MHIDLTVALATIVVGVGATAFLDLWAWLLKRAFGIPSSNYCLVGRWLRYMPEGVFRHESIAASPGKRFECSVGWMAHYFIGVAFAMGLVWVMSSEWLREPRLLPALVFGIVTVAVPFLVMHPAFGLGIAASKTPNPRQGRIRSVMSHAVFGVGLYVCALLLNALVEIQA